MAEREASRSSDPGGRPPGPLERRGRDGTAGADDQLGGLGAGAGDRLGPDEPGTEAEEAGRQAPGDPAGITDVSGSAEQGERR